MKNDEPETATTVELSPPPPSLVLATARAAIILEEQS